MGSVIASPTADGTAGVAGDPTATDGNQPITVLEAYMDGGVAP